MRSKKAVGKKGSRERKKVNAGTVLDELHTPAYTTTIVAAVSQVNTLISIACTMKDLLKTVHWERRREREEDPNEINSQDPVSILALSMYVGSG